jgi:hypothetical protein
VPDKTVPEGSSAREVDGRGDAGYDVCNEWSETES